MDFVAVVDEVIALLRQRGRVTYRTIQIQFALDDTQLAALKDELLYSQPYVVDDAGRGLVWTGDTGVIPDLSLSPSSALQPARRRRTHCHRSLGTLYAKTGQRERARTALMAAIALYRTMEMTFWLPQAEAALAQTGAQS